MRKLKDLITKSIIGKSIEKSVIGKVHKMILNTLTISIGNKIHRHKLKLIDNGNWNGSDTLVMYTEPYDTERGFDGKGSYVSIGKLGEPDCGEVFFSRGVLIDKKAIKSVIRYLQKVDDENRK